MAVGRPGKPIVRDDGAVYPSVSAAARDVGAESTHVGKAAVSGGTCAGHRWRWANADDLLRAELPTPLRLRPAEHVPTCSTCRKWTRLGSLGFGMCADGYTSAPTDTCARYR